MSLIIFLWWMSGISSLAVFYFAIAGRSWKLSLLSAVLFLPIAYYFGGANNAYRLIGLLPLIPIVLAACFFWRKR